MSVVGEIGLALVEKGFRLAECWFAGWRAARKRWNETAKETQERHQREDMEHKVRSGKPIER